MLANEYVMKTETHGVIAGEEASRGNMGQMSEADEKPSQGWSCDQ